MPKPTEGTLKVRLKDIDVSGRAREDMGDIYGLASSIKENGLINPIIVDELDEEKVDSHFHTYILIAGYRRYKAVESLKKEEIECRLYQDLSNFERRKLELEEDLIHKKSLSWPEEIKAKRRRIKNAELQQLEDAAIATANVAKARRDAELAAEKGKAQLVKASADAAANKVRASSLTTAILAVKQLETLVKLAEGQNNTVVVIPFEAIRPEMINTLINKDAINSIKRK